LAVCRTAEPQALPQRQPQPRQASARGPGSASHHCATLRAAPRPGHGVRPLPSSHQIHPHRVV